MADGACVLAGEGRGQRDGGLLGMKRKKRDGKRKGKQKGTEKKRKRKRNEQKKSFLFYFKLRVKSGFA